MGTWTVSFITQAEVTVTVEADAEDDAADLGWTKASDYLERLLPDSHGSRIDVGLDGIGAETVAPA